MARSTRWRISAASVEVVALAHEGRLWPVVDRVVPLAEWSAAVARLERGEQTGKLVIEVAT